MASLATFFVLFFSAFFGNIICQGIGKLLNMMSIQLLMLSNFKIDFILFLYLNKINRYHKNYHEYL